MKRMRRTDKDECPHCFSKAIERIDADQYQSSPAGWLFRCLDPNCGRAFVREGEPARPAAQRRPS
jgi:hypothetical protein